MKPFLLIHTLFFLSCFHLIAQENPSCIKDQHIFYREINSGGANLNNEILIEGVFKKNIKERTFEYFIFLATCCTNKIVVDSVIIDLEKYSARVQKVKSPFKIVAAIGDFELIKKTNNKLFRILVSKNKTSNARIEFNQTIQVFGKIKNKIFSIKTTAERLQPLVAQ